MYNSKKESKKKVIIIITILIVLIFLLIAEIILYLKTDLFKTDKDIFNAYFIKNLNDLKYIIDVSKEKEYIKTLEEKSYNEDTIINFSYTNNENQQETFTGNIVGTKNNEQNKSYKDLKVKLRDTDIIEVKYLNENELYGLQFVDIANMYATIDTSKSMSGIIKYLGLESLFTLDKMNLIKISELIDISEEEKQQILNKYISIILSKVEKSDYSSQPEKLITLFNRESVTTNCYTLTLNKDKLQQIYMEILKQLIQDETIIAKIENIDNKIKETGIKINKDLKTIFVDNVEKEINNINIQNELAIRLFENDKKVVKTTIQYGDKAIEIESNNKNSTEAQIYRVVEGQPNDIISVAIAKNEDTTEIKYKDFENRDIRITKTITSNTNNIKSTTEVQYGDSNIRNIQISIDQNLDLGEVEQIQETFEQNTKRVLNEYDNQILDYALGSLGDMILNKLNDKKNDTNSLILNYIIDYFNSKERQEWEEQNRLRKKFNNQFVLYTGNNLELPVVYNLLDEVGKNILNYQSVGDNEIRIYIKEGNENEELSEEIKKLLDDQHMYNIKVDYDENNFVNQVIITKVFEENYN